MTPPRLVLHEERPADVVFSWDPSLLKRPPSLEGGGPNQALHWFFEGKGLGIQQGTSLIASIVRRGDGNLIL